MQSGLERQAEPRQTGRTAAFIDRETDGDVSSSAAASSAGGGGVKKKKGTERGACWQNARCIVSMTSNMLIRFSIHTSSTQVTASMR